MSLDKAVIPAPNFRRMDEETVVCPRDFLFAITRAMRDRFFETTDRAAGHNTTDCLRLPPSISEREHVFSHSLERQFRMIDEDKRRRITDIVVTPMIT